MSHSLRIEFPGALYHVMACRASGSGLVQYISRESSAASAVTYRPGDAAMASWTSSNGLVNTLAYDSDGRLTGISVPTLQSLAFSYDNANRINKITNGINSALTQMLGYDAGSRLSTVTSTAENESYQYDADGNRLTAVVNGAGETYTYGPSSNQLTSFSSWLSAQYGYDAKGNTTLVNGTPSYQYDPFNRLSAAGGATNYVNPEGQRLRKAGGATGTTYFAPDTSGALMAEYNGMWVDYVRLNGRLIGRIGGGQVYAVHDDQVGRPEAVTDASRTVVWRAQNYPFTQDVTLASITFNLGFPGQYYDAETWTWNNGYRDYSSGFGRYMESDPIGLAGGVNTYAYVGNDPLSRVDPYGLFWMPGDPLPQGLVDGVAGFGDGISFGLSKYIRQQNNIDAVDYCDKAYGESKTAGQVYDVALAGVGGVAAAPYVAPYIPSAANLLRAGALAASIHAADPADMDAAWGPITDVVEQLQAYAESAQGAAENAEAAAGAQEQLPPH